MSVLACSVILALPCHLVQKRRKWGIVSLEKPQLQSGVISGTFLAARYPLSPMFPVRSWVTIDASALLRPACSSLPGTLWCSFHTGCLFPLASFENCFCHSLASQSSCVDSCKACCLGDLHCFLMRVRPILQAAAILWVRVLM